jgi:hypothetical protein
VAARLGLGNETILGAVVLATLTLSLRSGVNAVTGYLLAGALLGGWSYVYASSMCAGQPVVWAQLVRRAVGGAAAAPVIAVAGLVAGPVVWVMAAAGVVGWVMLVTPHGTVSIPARLRHGIDEHLRVMRLLRGR